MLNNDQVVDKLNHLLGTLKDGQTGYKEAAEEAENPQYKTMFNEYSQQRATLASEIEAEIRRLGGDPKDSGSAGAAVHRAWLNIRDRITGSDDKSVINEVERGEDVAVDNYQDVMKEDLPADVKSMLDQQYSKVKATHDKIRDIKHSLNA